MEVYADIIDRMDWDIGRILKSIGEMENTNVEFMSDNCAEGSSYETLPVVEVQVIDHLEKYYDNSFENIGWYNSFVWYASRWTQAAAAPSNLYKCTIQKEEFELHSSCTSLRLLRIGDSLCALMDIVPTFVGSSHRVEHPGTWYKGRRVERLRGIS
jgi:arylsulfatase